MGLVTVPPSPFPPSSGKTGDIAERVTELETDVSTLQTNVGTLGTTKAPKTDIAPAFSAETNYDVDDLVYYDGELYECTTEHTAGEWNSEHFTATVIDEQLSDLKSGLTSITTLVEPTMRDTATLDAGGYIVIGKMVLFDVTYTLTQNVTDSVMLFDLPNAGSRNVGLRLTNANNGSEVPSNCRIYGSNVYAGLNGNAGERYNVTGVYMKKV